jgi:hypothetical protein
MVYLWIVLIFLCKERASGNIADTVIKPSGGTTAFLEMKSNAYLKLQKEAGYWGKINNTFIDY